MGTVVAMPVNALIQQMEQVLESAIELSFEESVLKAVKQLAVEQLGLPMPKVIAHEATTIAQEAQPVDLEQVLDEVKLQEAASIAGPSSEVDAMDGIAEHLVATGDFIATFGCFDFTTGSNAARVALL